MISTPYVGQGVQAGTAVVLHGVKVGQVTDVTNIAGGVQLDTDLQKESTQGLTNRVGIDFRPINYFGVPGINLVPKPGGDALQDGSRVALTPSGELHPFGIAQSIGQRVRSLAHTAADQGH